MADTIPPVLNGLTLPSTVDVRYGTANATFTAAASDVGTGVEYVFLTLDHGYQTPYGLSTQISFTNSAAFASYGSSSTSLPFNSSTATGAYNIVQATVEDNAGNISFYSATQLQAAHLPTSFQVLSNVAPDNTPPVLSGLGLPSTIDISHGDTVAAFSASASDVGTGVQAVYLTLDHGFQSSNGLVTQLTFLNSQSSFSTGTSAISQSVSAQSATGTYNVTGAEVEDNAGNFTYYTTAQLQTAHINTSFQILSGIPSHGVQSAISNIDFNHDGMGDLFFTNTSGGYAEWQSSGNGFMQNVIPPGGNPTDWHIAGAGDFNGDGMTDLFWRNSTNGNITEWQSTGNNFNQNTYGANVATVWQVAGVGDFNGDGKSDLLWRNSATGDIAEWQSNGNGFNWNTYGANVSTAWQVAGVGDFSGDGKSDLFWRNPVTGDNTEWQSSGSGFYQNTYLVNVSADWQVAGVGDFNGDGKSDLLWRNNSGMITIWDSTGSGFSQNVYMDSSMSSAWHIANIGDFSGDGKSDILWRNDNGTYEEWQSNGYSFYENVYVNSSVSTNWSTYSDHHALI